MKTKLLTIIILLSVSFNMKSYCQDGKYISYADSNKYVAMTIRMDGDTAYIFKTTVGKDTAIGQRTYYLWDLKFVAHRVTIPHSGNYWFIPFKDTLPINLLNDQALTEECTSRGICANCPQPPAACTCTDDAGGANECQYRICPDIIATPCYTGSGVYIKASSVRMELGTYTSFVEGNRYVSATIFIEKDIAYIKKEHKINLLDPPYAIYNLTNIKITTDTITFKTTMIIPDNRYYWFIPFDDVMPFVMIGGGTSLTCSNRLLCSNNSSCSMIDIFPPGCKACACSDGYGGACEACIIHHGDINNAFCGSGIIIKSLRVLLLN